MLDIDANKIMGEMTSYCRKNGFFAKEAIWVAAGQIGQYNNSPSDWWAVYCRHQELSKVAIRILEMPATSAACERSFSQHGSIHSKKRNRLTNKHVEKLLYISQNLKLLKHESDETKLTKRESRERHPSHKGANESTSLSNFSPAAEVAILSVSASAQTSSENTKNRRRTEEEESDSECSMIPYDDSSDASLETILGDSREKYC